MFGKIAVVKKERLAALNIMKEFVEGKISTEDFWLQYKSNLTMQQVLINDKTRPKGVYAFNVETGRIIYDKKKRTDLSYYFNPENLLQVMDISKQEHRIALFYIVKTFFFGEKKKLNFLIRM